jgi:glycosyltransferase involved in cell wall biosynthesis
MAALWLRAVGAALRRPPRPRDPVPLVTVVIATYNRSEVLRHAIRSALWQSWPNLEILVVGDGCTDDSEKVARAFGDPRLHWIGLPENTGSQSTPNNEGLQRARGEYVAYLGHDDLWLPDHLARLIPALQRAGVGAGNTMVEILGPPGSNIRSLSGHEDGAYASPPSSVAHRREAGLAAGGWRDPRTSVLPPDRDFLSRLDALGEGFVRVKALTVIKLSASLRPDCYAIRSDAEQAACARRIASERGFAMRELAAIATTRLRRRAPRFPKDHPSVLNAESEWGPGEFVAALRRIKGIDRT